MLSYTNYIEDVYFFHFLSSLSNPTVYKEVRVLKIDIIGEIKKKGQSSLEKKKRSLVGRV